MFDEIATLAGAALAIAVTLTPASAAEVGVTCAQVHQRISPPLEAALGDDDNSLLVWSNMMVLAGCDSGKPEQITTKTRLDDATRLARAVCMATRQDTVSCYLTDEHHSDGSYKGPDVMLPTTRR